MLISTSPTWSDKEYVSGCQGINVCSYGEGRLDQAEGSRHRNGSRQDSLSQAGRFTGDDHAKVEAALAQTDLVLLGERLVDSLSGGERQRAWLAMMLAQDTRCLLLDEPTSALDIAHQVDMLALVHKLSRERGIGVVIVLHDINMAARYCDEIIAMGSGRIVARGTPAEILDSDSLARIYGLPMGILPHPATGAPISYVL